ncbi:helix-turn-helix transcriptional regulator [Aminobacter sp. HY435]|uniref:helix-turn-helix transcriptional regulator n=1 Tax=Aminobacter sp. HY435 TaxID=2970917 RepID=UPI0022B96735|nr:helix-turn-helix transcriptional regulator [Aminobacter sp. HY435]
MRIDFAKLDQALDRTLEAAIDTSLWPDILDRVAEATGAFGVNIVPILGRFPGGLISTDSLKPAMEGYFDGGWDKNEWRNRGFPILARRGTVLEQHYTTREDFKTQDYYRAQSRFGLGRTCIVGFGQEEDILCFVLHRKLNDDPYEGEHERIFSMMRDRLMMSATMMKHLSARTIDGMVEAFDMASIGAIFFDRVGKVTAVNARANECLGPHLQVTGGELVLRTSLETAQVRKRMRAVLTEQWLEPKRADPLVVERPGMKPLVLKIQRLGGALPDIFSHSVGVCLIEDLNPQSPPANVISKSLGLTPMEATLAMLLAEGASLRDAAASKAISYETARTHLRSIFSKLEVSRQSELVALVSRLRASQH